MKLQYIGENAREGKMPRGLQELRIRFDGGEVCIVRRPDGEGTWVHVTRNRTERGDEPAHFNDARIDCTDKHTAEADLGDLQARTAYHVALCVKEGKPACA